MKSNRVTIRDVAREAGVSTAAVSQAFNSNGRLSEQTRHKVLAVARHLKYHPNRHARNLAAKSTRTLGIVVSDIENPFFAVVMKNFEARARHYGFEVIASETSYELSLMRRAAERIMEQDVSGVAIFTSEMSPAWLDEIVFRNIPVACFDLDFVSERVSNVKVNYLSGMRQLIEHLYHLGHRRIAYAGGSGKLKNILSRHEAYLQTLAALGLEPGPVFTGNQRLDGGYAAGVSIMGLAKRPTAVVAVNDLTAVGLINAFSEGGLNVPGDISVAGFDNTYLAAYFVPRLTTVDMHPDRLGRTAADALHDSISSSGGGGKEYAIKIDLVVGKSTGPAPGCA
ncbi:MAG: LacI family DNA-binding transcriptional regulator [Acidobacteriota bacterium]|nr:LacI family DNA-binding transcriptional regulator [Acidobacteriota bacterium]